MTKLCPTCNIVKSTTEFHKHKRTKDGFGCQCKACCREYLKLNSDKIKQYKKTYNEKHYSVLGIKEQYKEKRKLKKHTENEYQREYVKNRKLNDPLYKMILQIRSGICNNIKKLGYKKNSKTAVILGCSYDDFKVHIENQFTEGMSWDNSGKWHYDHIIPISSAKSEQEVIELNHYTNFQPLWAEDNMQKGNKLNWTKI